MVFDTLLSLHHLSAGGAQEYWSASTHGTAETGVSTQAPTIHHGQKLDGYGSLCGPMANNCSGDKITVAVHFKPDHELYKDYLQDKAITVHAVHVQGPEISQNSVTSSAATNKDSYSFDTKTAFHAKHIQGSGMSRVEAQQQAMQAHKAEVQAQAKQVAANKAAEIHIAEAPNPHAGYFHQVYQSEPPQMHSAQYHSQHYSYAETHINGSSSGYPTRPPDSAKHPERVAMHLLEKGVGGDLSTHQPDPEMQAAIAAAAAKPGHHLPAVSDHWWAGHEHCPGQGCVLVPQPNTQAVTPTYMSGF